MMVAAVPEVFAIYLGMVPVVTIWAMLRGWRSDRPELTRCGAVVLGHAAVMQLVALFWPVVEGQGYPWAAITASLVAVLWVVCKVPATRACAMLAGSVLFGILSSLIYGVSTTLQGHQVHSDWAYFSAQFTMGLANLLILLGWTHELRLSRIVDRVVCAAARLVQSAHWGGVAR
jgi:hypothetical protein